MDDLSRHLKKDHISAVLLHGTAAGEKWARSCNGSSQMSCTRGRRCQLRPSRNAPHQLTSPFALPARRLP